MAARMMSSSTSMHTFIGICSQWKRQMIAPTISALPIVIRQPNADAFGIATVRMTPGDTPSPRRPPLAIWIQRALSAGSGGPQPLLL